MFLLQTTLIWLILGNLYFIEATILTNDGCPSGWFHVLEVGSKYCYTFLQQKIPWLFGVFHCPLTREAGSSAHAAMILNAAEHRAIGAYVNAMNNMLGLDSYCHENGVVLNFWTGGQREDSNCKKRFVWSIGLFGPYIPMNYTAWRPNQPDCGWGKETAVEVRGDIEAKMNDRNPDDRLCPLCQIERKI